MGERLHWLRNPGLPQARTHFMRYPAVRINLEQRSRFTPCRQDSRHTSPEEARRESQYIRRPGLASSPEWIFPVS